MSDPVTIMRARLDEATRRMVAAGVPEVLRFHQQGAFLKQVLLDEQAGLWSPFPAEDMPAAATSSPAPVASAPVPAPAAADPAVRSRSIWAKATTEANSELALSEPAPPADPQADAPTETQHTPPAGSVAKSRAAWTSAVDAANADLLRRGGRIGEA